MFEASIARAIPTCHIGITWHVLAPQIANLASQAPLTLCTAPRAAPPPYRYSVAPRSTLSSATKSLLNLPGRLLATVPQSLDLDE